jgi:hypothetical protein
MSGFDEEPSAFDVVAAHRRAAPFRTLVTGGTRRKIATGHEENDGNLECFCSLPVRCAGSQALFGSGLLRIGRLLRLRDSQPRVYPQAVAEVALLQ